MKTPLRGFYENREKELRGIFEGVDDDIRVLVGPTVENALYLEARMDEVSKLPMIQVHPNDPTKQRATPAAKLYKEFLQQYTNCIKLLASVLNKFAPEEESPLRKWVQERAKQNDGA